MPEVVTPSTSPASESKPSSPAKARLIVNDRDLSTFYANGFRSHASSEEVVLDLGMNTAMVARPQAKEGHATEIAKDIHFDLTHRVVMNYYTAKRLARLLGDLVRQHEQQFGELKLNPAERLTQGDT